MAEILGIAAALVIALLTQIVTPFSRIWWVGMAISTAVVLFAGGHLIYKHVRPETAQQGQSGIIPSPSLSPPRARSTERVIVDVKPADLMNMYENRMQTEAGRLFAPYAGKWMRLSGTVEGAAIGGGGPGESFVSFSDEAKHRLVFLYFDKQWTDRIATVRKGQIITVLCQILDAGSTNFRANHCEFQN